MDMATTVTEQVKAPAKVKRKIGERVVIDLKLAETLSAQGLTRDQIALAMGIARSTLFRYQQTNEDFADAIKAGAAKGVALVSSLLMEQAKKGNVTAQIFFLKARGGWRETSDLNVKVVPWEEAIQKLDAESAAK